MLTINRMTFNLIYPFSFYGFCPLHGILPSTQPRGTERFLRLDPGTLNVLSVESSDDWRRWPEYFVVNQSQSLQQLSANYRAYRCTDEVRMLLKLISNWILCQILGIAATCLQLELFGLLARWHWQHLTDTTSHIGSSHSSRLNLQLDIYRHPGI